MSIAYIMDTSFLLELNKIPGKSDEPRITQAKNILDAIDDEADVYITVPILFEYAGHMSYIGVRKEKHKHVTKLNRDICGSLDDDIPWIIYGRKKEIFLATNVIRNLSKRFTGPEKFDYSFADLSIIQAKEQLVGLYDKVEILTFEEKLTSHRASSR